MMVSVGRRGVRRPLLQAASMTRANALDKTLQYATIGLGLGFMPGWSALADMFFDMGVKGYRNWRARKKPFAAASRKKCFHS